MNFTFNISMNEILIALLATNRADGYVVTDSIDLSPGSSVEYSVTVPKVKIQGREAKKVAIPIELVPHPDPDYIISCSLKTDNIPILEDDSMCSGVYAVPIDFLKKYALSVYAKDELTLTFTNTDSSETATISFRFVFIVMDEKDYKKIINAYASKVKDWLLTQEEAP